MRIQMQVLKVIIKCMKFKQVTYIYLKNITTFTLENSHVHIKTSTWHSKFLRTYTQHIRSSKIFNYNQPKDHSFQKIFTQKPQGE